MKSKNSSLFILCEGGICIALGVVLSFFELDVGLSGGDLSLAMIPIMVFIIRRGFVWGMGAGLAFGLLKCIVGGGIGWGLPSILLDYVLAYGALSLGAVACRSKYAPVLSSVIGTIARFVIHFISGLTLYAITTQETIYGIVCNNTWIYSLIYNGGYMLPNIAITAVGVTVLAASLKKTPYRVARITA